jgi:hypothetical protein
MPLTLLRRGGAFAPRGLLRNLADHKKRWSALVCPTEADTYLAGVVGGVVVVVVFFLPIGLSLAR